MKNIISILIVICIIVAVVTIIAMAFGCEFKSAIVIGGMVGLASLAPSNKKYTYQVSYTVNGQLVTERIRADSQNEVQNLIYSKYPGQVIGNIIITRCI